MKHIIYVFFFIAAFTISLFAQNHWHPYPVRTIANIVKAHSGEASQRSDLIISANLFPSKTKVNNTGKSRPTGKRTTDFRRSLY